MGLTTLPASAAAKFKPATATRAKEYLVFAALACLYILPFMRLLMVGTDEGTLDYGAVRIIHGQVFARDFFEVMGPGTFYWLAAFFKVFGVSFFASRVDLFVTSLGTVLLMYLFARKVCVKHRILPCILFAATYFGGLWPAISHHVDSNFFALMTVACMIFWLERGGRAILLIAGALAGATTAFLQPKGALLLVALFAFLWLQRRSRSGFLISTTHVAAGYAGVVATILLYFWSKGALHDLFYVNVIWPGTNYSGVNSVPYAHGILTNYWNHWVLVRSQIPWIVPIAVVLFVPIVTIAILPAFLVASGVRFRHEFRNPAILLLWLCGGAIWLSELHRMEMTHVIFGSPLWIILFVHYLERYDNKKIVRPIIQLLTISAVCLAGFNVCLLLPARKIDTRAGSVRVLTGLVALPFLQQHTRPEEEIFVYPYTPSYYFLTAATNPTRYSLLIHNYNTAAQFLEVVHTLGARKTRYVVWDHNLEKIAEDVFPSSSKVAPGDLILERYIESNYRPVFERSGVSVMERTSEGDEGDR